MTAAAPNLNQAFELFQAGRLGEAESVCRQVLAKEPAHFHVRHLLGVILCQDGRLEEGLRYIRAVIETDPGHPGPHRSLGSALLEARRPEEALPALQRSLQIDPGNAPAWNNLGLALRQTGQIDESASCFRRALELAPEAVDTLNNLAVILMLGPEAEQAIPLLERAIRIAPDYEDSYSNLASLYEQSNRLEEAKPAIEAGLARFPQNPLLQLLAARLERREGREAEAIERLQALQASRPPADVEKGLHFELGKIYDKAGDADQAFEHFQRGNALAVELWERRADASNSFTEELAAITDTLTPDVLAGWESLDLPSPPDQPVFLVGFFRSGTTLLDTVLESHGGFQVLEERPTIAAVIDALNETPEQYPRRLLSMTRDEILALRETYFSAVSREFAREPGKQLLDKFPANTVSAALIHRLFPQARIIFALRHPCDVCLSCYMQNFGETDLMVNFAELENTARVYARVMEIWKTFAANLPLNYHILRYESMVADLEGEMRGLLGFLGVDWSDSVLQHADHALKRGRIRTPSYHQVAQPIYQHASYRWQRYRSHLEPILEILQPAIDYFDYD